MLIKSKNFTAAELSHFLELQRISFSILEDMGASLEEGVTERDVARTLVRKYRDAGATSFFHLPVTLFGARTALPGDWKIGKFYPKDLPLKAGDSVILDASPLFGAYMVDTSYSFCFGKSDAHKNMMRALAPFRNSVCDSVNLGRNFAAIASDVERSMHENGYEPVHTKHPGEVLGHRALKTATLPFTWRIRGFDGLSLGWFILKGRAAASGIGRENPTWNSQSVSDHPPHDGLWLVEPHAGAGVTGAKWEEILVIERGRARWLDDDPPHVRQWRAIAAGRNYAPNAAAR